MVWNADWTAAAACRGTDPDSLFVQGAAQNRAKTICMGCSVRTECLADALDNRVEFGVWGGMTERERRALLRRRPNITSWRQMLQTAQEEYLRSVAAPSTPAASAEAAPAEQAIAAAPARLAAPAPPVARDESLAPVVLPQQRGIRRTSTVRR
jgi:WhiB family redox-sensing transcriptional regulator